MRILILHLHDQHYQMGGADRGVLDLASALQANHSDEIRILTNAGSFAQEAEKKGICVVEILHSKFAILKTWKIIDEQIKSFRPEVFHSHHRYTTFLLDLFFKGRGMPILHTQRIQTWSKRFFFRSGDFMTTVSESLRQHMMSCYGVPADRIKTIVNAVSSKSPDLGFVQELKRRFPRQAGEIFALCVGRFHAQKGHSYLIEAIEKLEPEYRKRIKIFLAGDGPLENELRQTIEQKNLKENFIFLGYVQEISEYLEFCDLFILSSLWEGLPRVILEAFSMGRPAIATNVPGTSDVLEDQKNGLLVSPRNAEEMAHAIRYIVNHHAELAKMQEGASQSAKKYSFEAMVRSYHELYQELIRKYKK
ncbi:MAG: glycosyltransferase family 4 protein [Candidatus Omnitrophica bacterium]|nr:glycosyltransferase family 4 protein [Candidatus Omnitrophota bacterium]